MDATPRLVETPRIGFRGCRRLPVAPPTSPAHGREQRLTRCCGQHHRNYKPRFACARLFRQLYCTVGRGNGRAKNSSRQYIRDGESQVDDQTSGGSGGIITPYHEAHSCDMMPSRSRFGRSLARRSATCSSFSSVSFHSIGKRWSHGKMSR